MTANNLSKKSQPKPKVTYCSVITQMEFKMYAYIFPYISIYNKKNLEQHMSLSLKDSHLQHPPGKQLALDGGFVAG